MCICRISYKRNARGKSTPIKHKNVEFAYVGEKVYLRALKAIRIGEELRAVYGCGYRNKETIDVSGVILLSSEACKMDYISVDV